MNKYEAVWVSHSSLSDFRNCPRAYYLKNIYRDPHTGHKIALTNPALALGSAVHEVLESLSTLPTSERFTISLIDRFKPVWSKYKGNMGGFSDPETEEKYRQKGEEMLARVTKHPGPLERLAVKIKMDLPNYWLSEEDGIILCGKLDWLEYIKGENGQEDGVHIIDFKTGKKDEPPESLQLPIYYLLAHNCQTREVKKASYWYIARDDLLSSRPLPDLDKSRELVLKAAKEVKLARSLERFKCPEDSNCKYCAPFEKIIKGDAEFVGTDLYDRDVYAFISHSDAPPDSEIL